MTRIWAEGRTGPGRGSTRWSPLPMSDFYVPPRLGARPPRRESAAIRSYFPDRVCCRCCPEFLSAECSARLKEGEDSAGDGPAICIFNGDGKVIEIFRFTRAAGCALRIYIAYEDCEKAVDSGNPPEYPGASLLSSPPLFFFFSPSPLLSFLGRPWKALFRRGHARDPLELELPERRVVLNEKGQDCRQSPIRERPDAHRVVEVFMIAANVRPRPKPGAKDRAGRLPRPRTAEPPRSCSRWCAYLRHDGTRSGALGSGLVTPACFFNNGC